MTYVSTQLDSWLDKDYLISISDKIVELNDLVPKIIEMHLPNYDDRKKFLNSNFELIDSDEFQLKQILDQRAGGTTWEEHVTIYDDFFKRHPEFSKLIKDKEAYEKWKLEEVPY
ncbi:hypothetical protein [Methanobrevibacter sp.]|uniref:hypothetical protein n=1 Tax=Methanobrevibacter sp. TaxID=66852 RepID=UPI00388FBAB1